MDYLVFFDLETSGLNPDEHAIIEVGALAVSLPDFEVVDTFEAKVAFKIENAESGALLMNSYASVLPEEVHAALRREYDERKAHTLKGEEVLSPESRVLLESYYPMYMKEARGPRPVARDLAAFFVRYGSVLKRSRHNKQYYVARLAGHNIIRFDLPFLQNWFKRLGDFLPADYFAVDTLQMAITAHIFKNAGYDSFKLLHLCEYHGIIATQEHAALSDLYLTAALAHALAYGYIHDNELSQNVETQAERLWELAQTSLESASNEEA